MTHFQPQGSLYLLVLLMLLSACRADQSGAAAGGDSASETLNAQQSTVAYYQEALRPQLHFTPSKGKVETPVAAWYAGGEYHLFYQRAVAGWGQVASTNLLRWDQIPASISPGANMPEALGLGGVVVDENNSSGLGADGKSPVIAVQSSEGQLVFYYSLDGGYRWTKVAEQPQVGAGLQSPKLLKQAVTGKWLLAGQREGTLEFFESSDLKAWTKTSTFSLPISAAGKVLSFDLFPVREYLSSTLNHVLLLSVETPQGNSTSYFVGDVQGGAFVARTSALRLDFGPDLTGLTTVRNSPTPANRVLAIGGLAAPAASLGTAWSGGLAMSRVLTLHDLPEGPRLQQLIVPDLYDQRVRKLEFNRTSDFVPSAYGKLLKGLGPLPYEFRINTPADVVLDHRFTIGTVGGDTLSFGFDAVADAYFVDATRVLTGSDEASHTRYQVNRQLRRSAEFYRVVIDRCSIELFGDDGFSVLSVTTCLDGVVEQVELSGPKGLSGTIFTLRPELPAPESVARVRLGLN